MPYLSRSKKRTVIKSFSLDIVLPCYNPTLDWGGNIVVAAQSLEKALPNTTINWIVVDDFSAKGVKDSDISFLQNQLKHFNYIKHKKNQGKGAAVKTGAATSHADFMIFTDIDIPFGVENIVKIIQKLQSESDVVFIKRNDSYFGNIPPTRQKISRLAKWFNRKIFGLPFTDTQGGLKGFSQEGKKILLNLKINRYLFDIELAKKASKNSKIKLTQVEASTTNSFTEVSTNYWRLLKEIPDLIYLIFS